jgi:hypothetical protein
VLVSAAIFLGRGFGWPVNSSADFDSTILLGGTTVASKPSKKPAKARKLPLKNIKVERVISKRMIKFSGT